MNYLFLIILYVTATISLHAGTLGERFDAAEAGDFMVLAHDKHVTLFHILDKSHDRIVIEEITAQERFVPTGSSWQDWVQANAPHHSGWTISTFEKSASAYRHLSTYSYDSHEWLSLDEQLSFLPTLFGLPLEKVALADRKRTGVPPMPGEIDRRLIWNPRIVFDGKEQKLPTDVYTITVPKDIPDIGSKKLDLYFPVGKACLNYFPYWIEVRGGIAKVKLHAIDSGTKLISPAAAMVHIPNRAQKNTINTESKEHTEVLTHKN